MDWVYYIDILGTLVFAISGILTAIENKFDIVGALIIGLITAVGGGTLRDILIGQTPVGWMLDLNYLWTVVVAFLLTYFFKDHISQWRKGMFLFDTIGIGLFTIIGVEKTLEVGLPIPIALIMGVVSAVFGGVIRDVLTNIVPLIFRKEIYATACFLGGLAYLGLQSVIDNQSLNMIISMMIVILIRVLAVKRNWSLQF